MLALRLGLQYLQSELPRIPIGRRRLLICTDSQSLIAHLKKGAPTATSAAADITNALRALSAHGFRIRFQFVFSHCGVERNEEVDKAADSACDLPFTSPCWYVDALNVAHGIIREEETLRPNRRYEAVEAVRTKKHPPNRQHATLAAGLRCDWSPFIGDLARILDPRLPPLCRWCSTQAEAIAAIPHQESRKRGRTTDPVRCPECNLRLATRSSAVSHMTTHHQYSRPSALKVLVDAPEAPELPTDLTCSHCTFNAKTIPGLGRHIKEMHPETLKRRLRSPPKAAPADEPPPQVWSCSVCLQQFKSKAGLSSHSPRIHQLDFRRARP